MSRVVHFEIMVDDIERAKAFYAAVFGWTFEDYSSFLGGTPYWGVFTGETEEPGINGGLMQRSAPAAAGGANAYVATIGIGDYDETERSACIYPLVLS